MTIWKLLPSAGSASVCSNLSALQDKTSPSAHRWAPSGAGWGQEKAVTVPLLTARTFWSSWWTMLRGASTLTFAVSLEPSLAAHLVQTNLLPCPDFWAIIEPVHAVLLISYIWRAVLWWLQTTWKCLWVTWPSPALTSFWGRPCAGSKEGQDHKGRNENYGDWCRISSGTQSLQCHSNFQRAYPKVVQNFRQNSRQMIGCNN